jgi:hypothetical protein
MIRRISRHNKQVVEMLNVLARKPGNILKAISLSNAAMTHLLKIFVFNFHATSIVKSSRIKVMVPKTKTACS